jgi:hypothetical protein
VRLQESQHVAVHPCMSLVTSQVMTLHCIHVGRCRRPYCKVVEWTASFGSRVIGYNQLGA